jgi:hypothetical protein
VENLDVMRLAMAALVPESWRSLLAIYNTPDDPAERHSRQLIKEFVVQAETSLMVTDDQIDDSLTGFALFLGWNNNGTDGFAILSYPATVTRANVAFVIESVAITWWDEILDYVIPFDRIIFGIFLRSFQTILTQAIVGLLFGPRRFSYTSWSEAITRTQAIQAALVEPVSLFWAELSNYSYTPLKLVTGDGAYGLLAKAIAIDLNISGVAFNAPKFDASPISFWTRWYDGAATRATDSNLTSRILNVFAGNSLQFSEETKWVTRTNWEWPEWKWPWQSVSAAETFCMTVAGCATDDRFVDMCNSIMEKNLFDELFDVWQRPRLP